MPSSDPLKDVTTFPEGGMLPASALSTASTLTSQTNSQSLSMSSRLAMRQPDTLQTHDENKVTEFDPSGLASSLTKQSSSVSTAQRKINELKRDMYEAGAELPQYKTRGLFKEAYSTDLLFLIDATSSMGPYINAAKDQVKAIIKDIKATFFNEADIRIAIVSYRDHTDKSNIQCLDFTTDTNSIHSFLDKLAAKGGSDAPEDVLGGIARAIQTTWKHSTRCMIHIADAPPHGTKYHDLTSKEDSWPEAGTEPHGLTLEPLVLKMIKLNINYALLRITKHTDRMASVIFETYAAASAACKLHVENRYSSKFPSRQGTDTAVLFEEQALGTKFSALQHLVVRSVTQSASRSAVRLASTLTKTTTKQIDTSLAIVSEEDSNNSQMETKKPQWDKRGWLDENFTVEGFAPDLSLHSTITLNDMLEHEDNIKIKAVELEIHKRSRPFSQGAIRLAYYTRAQTMTDQFVVKTYKKGGKPFAHFAKDMQCQALCKAFALEFNSLLGREIVLDFVLTMCLKDRRTMSITSFPDEEERCLSLEPYLPGTYIKYNSNAGYVNTDLPATDLLNKAAQAFSHFTYERSRGKLLVCDLQGAGKLLTDPAIHSLDPERFKLDATNLGADGFKFFFATHVCNDICVRLQLKSNADKMRRGIYEYRSDWPGVNLPLGANIFRCCSNILCGKVTRLPPDFDPTQPQGYHWCHTCYLQMRSSLERIVCTAVPKPKHDFTVSKFICESQGLPIPRACPKHRGLEVEMLEKRRSNTGASGFSGTSASEARRASGTGDSGVATVEGGSFWSRIKGKKSSK